MTPDDLRRYKKAKKIIQALEQEIALAYAPIRSPKLDKNDTGKLSATLPGNPTEQALERIEALNKKKRRLEAFTGKVEGWVNSLEDRYIAKVCAFHYLEGNTWEETAQRIGGSNTAESTRKAAQRYFDTYKV